MKGTIKELFTTEFGFDLDKMKVDYPYEVAEAKIGVKAYDSELGEDCIALVTHAVKKSKQTLYKIKLENRDSFEQPVAGRHMYAVMKSYDSNEYDFGFVENMVEGCSVITQDGPAKIEKIEKLGKDYIYDITTDAENYYTNGILSHNSIGAHLPSQTGGTALRFFSSTRCRIQKMDAIKKGDDVIGIQIRVRNYKNKTSVPNRDALMDLYFDGGFNSTAEYLQFIVDFDMIHKAGGWYSWVDTENKLGEAETNKNGELEPKTYKWQGGAKVQDWLNEHPEIYDEFKKAVDNKLCVANELDANNVDPEAEDAAEKGIRLTKPSEAQKKEMEDLAAEALAAGAPVDD